MDPGEHFSQRMSPETPADRATMAALHPYYRQAVGSLMYLMNCTRPDLAYALSVFSRFLANPGHRHWTGIQQVLRFLKGTTEVGLTYTRCAQWHVHGFCDSDYGGDVDTRRSTTGYVIIAGGGPIQWRAKLQPTVSLSVSESEYKSASALATDNFWLVQFLREIHFSVPLPMSLWCDNQGALNMMDNPVCHDRTKHIDIKYHYVREQILAGNCIFSYIPTADNLADMFTKALTLKPFTKCSTDMRLAVI